VEDVLEEEVYLFKEVLEVVLEADLLEVSRPDIHFVKNAGNPSFLMPF
jgi:hypothetical protein